MRAFIFIVLLILFFTVPVMADELNLSAAETLQPVEAYKIKDWEITKLNFKQKIMLIRYRYADADGNVLYQGNNRGGYLYWLCENALADDPDTTLDETTCFDGIWEFAIRQQDVGATLKVATRTLLENRAKQKGIISSGNTVTYVE